jgi:hypothetical protein
MGKM